MNKSELIDSISNSADVSKASASRVLDALCEAVAGSLKDSEPVAIAGFGTFSVRDRAARTGRNPRTGEAIQIAASRVPAFKAGKALRDAVNG